MSQYLDKKSWWISIRFKRKRYRKRSPENTKAGAQAYEALLRQKLARGESLDDDAGKVSKPQTFEQFARKWYEVYSVPNNKVSEQKMKRSSLKCWLIPHFGKMSIKDITELRIEEFKAKAIGKGLKNKSINNHLAVLSKCLKAGYEWQKLEGTPPKIVWLKCPPPKTDYLSPDESALLYSGANGLLQEMILTALRTGMRLGEMIGLQWSSINWQNQTITVRHSMCYYSHKLISPKSNKIRLIPMDVDVYEMLLQRKKETGFVFTNAKNEPLDGRTLLKHLKVVAAKAGLRDIHWHTLRHTFATRVAEGAPIHAVQSLLGHSSINTTMRYAHVAPATLRSAIAMLNPKTAINSGFGQPVDSQWLEAQSTKSEKH